MRLHGPSGAAAVARICAATFACDAFQFFRLPGSWIWHAAAEYSSWTSTGHCSSYSTDCGWTAYGRRAKAARPTSGSAGGWHHG
mmetsp:Transcript_4655/g.10872  ORF Transcript_4655/g.10872 Transcript_4655/m.10872 type:complete len:84 (+) Transcript_4655:2593-2844(+)